MDGQELLRLNLSYKVQQFIITFIEVFHALECKSLKTMNAKEIHFMIIITLSRKLAKQLFLDCGSINMINRSRYYPKTR